MITILEFIFQSFWTWAGSVIRIAAASGAIGRIFGLMIISAAARR